MDKDDDFNKFKDDITGFNFYEKSWENLGDLSSHGTHVAGITGLDHNKSAHKYNSPGLRIMTLTVADQTTGKADLHAALCAMDYGIREGAKILNCSWGYYSPDTNKALLSVLNLARDENVLVVTSAGNNGLDTDICLHWPSGFADALDNVISVAAMNKKQNGLWKWSNYGKNTVTVATLGEDVESILPDGSCKIKCGTSMAAAMITRRVAVDWINNTGPRLPFSPSTIKADLISTSDKTYSLQIESGFIPASSDFVCP